MRRSRLAVIAPLLLAPVGCAGPQSMMDPAGPGAASINTMWWVLLAVMTAVFVLVMAALGFAIFRRRDEPDEDREAGHAGQVDSGPGAGVSGSKAGGVERRRVLAVLTAGAFVPAVILTGILVYTMVVLDEIGPGASDGDLVVAVTGKQFWWDVEYTLPDGETVRTANEIHIPVGRRVTFRLESDDVIHSLWVPRLHGKTDMIPGRTTEMWVEADEPGVYRGQCAEYCGEQHTWMSLEVVAEPESEFRGWLARQRRPAAPPPPPWDPAEAAMMERGPETTPADSAAIRRRADRVRRGLEVYLDPEHRCTACHVIRGENERVASPGERSVDGPDLTHLASRRRIAGGMLPLNRGHLGGWLGNPQVLKPGNLMPHIPLEPDELNALVDYLMTLR